MRYYIISVAIITTIVASSCSLSQEERYVLAAMHATEGSQSVALPLFHELAEEGYGPAHFALGQLYREGGGGIEQDYEKAMDWYLKSVMKYQIYEAEYWIGVFYMEGYGVEQDYSKAEEFFKLAAKDGVKGGHFALGVMYYLGYGEVKQDYPNALHHFERSSELDDDDNSQLYIGEMHDEGKWVEQNYEEAMKWYLLSAEKDNDDAQMKIGKMYEEGKGVEQDYKEAMKWYLLSAEKGNDYAEIQIAGMYEEGKGVEQSYDKYYEWLGRLSN